jgi:hypothetical protein
MVITTLIKGMSGKCISVIDRTHCINKDISWSESNGVDHVS